MDHELRLLRGAVLLRPADGSRDAGTGRSRARCEAGDRAEPQHAGRGAPGPPARGGIAAVRRLQPGRARPGEDAFPGKPPRELVCTHFHYDHVGGVREFAADGDLTVHVGTPSVAFFERALAAPHEVDPDRLATTPAKTTVRGIDDTLTFETAGGGTVSVHRIVSDHADDMVIVHVSSGKLVFNSDRWNPTPAPPAPADQRGRLTTELYDAIQALGLDVDTVVGGHRGSDGTTWAHAAPLEYLKRAAGY
ncbi:MBL fold metallo-hydrolase [Amycolatopsis sp. NPDC049253]|uniref:MBL fold metallo-hydrolase n=1 Tax=Amycolatopsis sp. NPDC049253 TaxID=3155274 RepID=UPI00343E00C6